MSPVTQYPRYDWDRVYEERGRRESEYNIKRDSQIAVETTTRVHKHKHKHSRSHSGQQHREIRLHEIVDSEVPYHVSPTRRSPASPVTPTSPGTPISPSRKTGPPRYYP